MAPANPTRERVLIIDDDDALREALRGLLERSGYRVSEAAAGATALAIVRREPIDLALLDLRLGSEDGLDLLPELKGVRPELSVVMVTAQGSIEIAVEAMRRGADNFVVKPVEPPRLLAIVAKGVESRSLRQKNLQLGRLSARAPDGILGSAAGMRSAVALADRVAEHDTTVLLLGETGTGKGLLARHIHDRSARKAGAFVELNCAGLKAELTESELFGHERGAFTGASERKLGLFEAADGGSLFLDEIGEMDLAVQAKLLKVLEERRFRRVGGVTEIEVDVRVIAATHRDLGRESAAGRFREDLLYRLNVFSIPIPPLRERREDIVPLATAFLARFLKASASEPEIQPDAAAMLRGYDWPGNVRELRNVVERAAILGASSGRLEAAQLPLLVPTGRGPQAPAEPGLRLDEVERRYLEMVLRSRGGNIQATARELGISRGTLYRKVKKFGIPVGPEEGAAGAAGDPEEAHIEDR